MVKHSTLKEGTIKAKEPDTKTRNKKYTKSRPKKPEQQDDLPQKPSPQPRWWKNSCLYRLFCCQNTVYSAVLYVVLVIFIALFAYAVWKICVVYLATKVPKQNGQLLRGKGSGSSIRPWHSVQGSENQTNHGHGDFKETFFRKFDPKIADVSEHSGLSSTERWNTQVLGSNSGPPKIDQEHLPPWDQNDHGNQDVQGDKRYIIPPSPPRFHHDVDNLIEGSGGNPLDQWRVIRYNLLKNRLQLTTASSYPTESPYWKAWYMSRYTTRSPYPDNRLRESKKSSSVYPVYDDLSKARPTGLQHSDLIPKVVISRPSENGSFKHSRIEPVRSNTTIPSAYNRLLQDLFSKIPALRAVQATVKPVKTSPPPQASPLTNTSFLTSLLSAWQRGLGNYVMGSRLGFSGLPTQKYIAANITTRRVATTPKLSMTNGTTLPRKDTTTKDITTAPTTTATTVKTTAKATTATNATSTAMTVTTRLTTTATTASLASTKTTRRRSDAEKDNGERKPKKKHSGKHKHHLRKRHHSHKKKSHKGDAARKSEDTGKRKHSDSGYHLQGADLPMAASEVLGSDGTGHGGMSGSGSGAYGESGSGETIAGSMNGLEEKGQQPVYVGLRERLRHLRKKKSSKSHRKEKLKAEKLPKDEDFEENGTTRDVISKKSHHHEKKAKNKGKHKATHSKKSHKDKETDVKKRKHSHHPSSKHKFMKIVQHKLLRMKQKNQIASRLKKVQEKMKKVHKRKHSKKAVKGKRRGSIAKPGHDSKFLNRRIMRKEEPKRWRKGRLSLETCAILKEFKHRHYVGLNQLWRSNGKKTFAVTECSSRGKHRHHYKCRRTFFRTQGYLGLKPTKTGGKRRLYLVVCEKEKYLKKALSGALKETRKASIEYVKKEGHGSKKNKKKRRKEHQKILSKKSHISHHRPMSSSKRRHKHSRHRHSRKHKKKVKHVEDEDNDGENGSDEDSSGDEEERVERSTTTSSKAKHHKRHRRKGGRKGSKKLNVSQNNTTSNASAKTAQPDSARLYAEFADMMAEMKQEIKNVTRAKDVTKIVPKLPVAQNVSMLTANASLNASNKTSNQTEKVGTSATKTNETMAKTSSTKSAITPGTIQDMVAELVPAIMKQFQGKQPQLPTSSANVLKTTSKLQQATINRNTTVKSTITEVKTSTSTATTKMAAKSTTKPTSTAKAQPTTKTTSTTKAHPTPHPSTRHHTTPHHTPTAKHGPTKHHTKPLPKSTSSPNLAMIIKGLKALGLTTVGQHGTTTKPSQVGSSGEQHTGPAGKKPTAKAGNAKQPPLPPPIQKPAKLHNQYLLNILCFGDSLTAGYHNHGKAFWPYSNHLKQLVTFGTKVHVSTTVKGIVGEMTHKQMVSRLPEILGNNSVFDWVIILGGTNDILHVKNFADDQEFLSQLESVWQPRITKDIEKLHNIAHNYGARTMLLTIPENAIEVWPGYRILMTMRNKINDALRQFANQHRDRIVLCDLAKRLPRHSLTPPQEALFWDDHLHMTPKGYDRMAEEVYKCLRPYIPKG